jgi:hypothetical protein
MDYITQETNLISILEIQGIKFTSRNFQIEIELKQVMVLDSDPIFDNFLIKTDTITKEQMIQPSIQSIVEECIPFEENNILFDNEIHLEEMDTLVAFEEEQEQQEKEKEQQQEQQEKEQQEKDETISLDFEELEENNDLLSEVNNFDVSLEKNEDTIQLKKPNQVYFELYKEARNKAKLAKRNAIVAYLEAKNIKKTYMIENLVDSDSDFDAEIDEVSESELEDL